MARGRPGVRDRRVRGRSALSLVLAAVLVAGCGGDEPDPAATQTVTITPLPAPDATEPTSPAPTATPDADTTDDPTDAPAPLPDDELAGVPWDGFAAEGDVLAVVGVAADDVLNVRRGPGTDEPVVAEAAPTEDGIVATGRARELPSSLWYEVELDGVLGWASTAFLAFPGPVDDVTAAFLAERERPEADTMEQLGELVAETYASTEPASRVVQVVAPSVGDLGEVTYDVLGLGDDAGLGHRVHVFATPSASGEGFVLRTIELRTWCARGVVDGLCA